MNRTSSKLWHLTNSKPFFSAIRFSSQLIVSRLLFYTINEKFKSIFFPFGDVKEAKLIMDSKIGKPKGFGFVTFESEANAQKAIKGLNLRIVEGRLIVMEFANTTKTDGEDAGSRH